MDYTSLPEELRTLPRWVNWRGIPGEGRINKPPVDPVTGAICNIVTDPQTWQPFEQALKHTGEEHVDGVGLVMVEDGFPPLIGIDIDHCLNKETGEIDPEARAYVDALDSYTEISPSGEGLRVFVYGVKPGPKCKRGNYEMYSRDRYLTVTGNHWPGSPKTLEYRQEAVDKLYREKIEKLNGNPSCDHHREDIVKPGFPGTDEELLEKARISGSTEDLVRGLRSKFVRLYDDGDTRGLDDQSASSADMSCACMLAFWCGPDPERIERLLRASPGLRALRDSVSSNPDKWERSDYLKGTVEKAIEFQQKGSGFYDADYQAREKEEASKPVIEARAGDLHRMVLEAETALARLSGIYNRNGTLVQVSYSKPTTSYLLEKDPNFRMLRFVQLDPHTTAMQLCRAATWKKFNLTQNRLVNADPPEKVCRALLKMGTYEHVPVVTGLVHIPTIRQDGSILAQPGYDLATGLIFDPGAEVFPLVNMKPTKEELQQAVQLLREPFKDFPFLSETDRSVSIATLLEIVQRGSLQSAPLYVIEAPTSGTGKTLIAQVPAMVLTGKKAAEIAYPTTEEEREKTIMSILMEGSTFVLFDNANVTLRSDVLAQTLSGDEKQGRVLGVNQMQTVSSAVTTVATGNRIKIAGDLATRTLRSRIDAEMEHPENRPEENFDHNLHEWVPANRARLVWAALTLIRAYLAAGSPSSVSNWARFETWNARVRAPMVWAGFTDPYESNAEIKEEDEDAEKLGAILNCWYAVFESEAKSVRDINDTHHYLGDYDGESLKNLKEVLEDYFPPKTQRDRFNRKAFGIYLKKIAGQPLNNLVFRLDRRESHSNKPFWSVQRV